MISKLLQGVKNPEDWTDPCAGRRPSSSRPKYLCAEAYKLIFHTYAGFLKRLLPFLHGVSMSTVLFSVPHG